MRRNMQTVGCGDRARLDVCARAASAHHAFSAEFDADKPITLAGRGHASRLDQPAFMALHRRQGPATGKVVPWKVEMGAPNQLLRRAGTRTRCRSALEVIVEGYRAKNGSDIANGGNVVLADGRKLFVGSSGTGAPYEEKEKK